MAAKIDDFELRSEEVQEILTKVPHWMVRWGNIIFLIIILIFLSISWFVKYPDIIKSEAIITTETPPEKVYSMATGKLEAIVVNNNELVDRGKTLAIIKNTASYQDVFKLKDLLQKINLNEVEIKIPLDNLPILFLGEIEPAFALLQHNYTQLMLNQRLDPYSNEKNANHLLITELNGRLNNLIIQKDLFQSELKFEKRVLERKMTLYDKGMISAQEYENAELLYHQAERNYKSFLVSISQLKQSISDAQKNQRATTITYTKEKVVLQKNVIQALHQVRNAIKEWEKTYVLKSSIKGITSFLHYWDENQSVRQGDLVFTIIPHKDSPYIAKLKTPSQNSGKIEIGQRAKISIDNYPDSEFGVLEGRVKSISNLPDNEGFYYIDIQLSDRLITSYQKEIKFKQEMRGTGEIITKDLRLLERFFHQFKKLLNR